MLMKHEKLNTYHNGVRRKLGMKPVIDITTEARGLVYISMSSKGGRFPCIGFAAGLAMKENPFEGDKVGGELVSTLDE